MRLSLRSIFYVRIAPERIDVRNVGTGESMADVPEIALRAGARPVIVAIGDKARAAAASDANVFVVNPFADAHVAVSDVVLGSTLLKAYLHQLHRGLLRIAPVIVVHPVRKPEGSLGDDEKNALRKMASEAGASKVVLWQGRVLADVDLHGAALSSLS